MRAVRQQFEGIKLARRMARCPKGLATPARFRQPAMGPENGPGMGRPCGEAPPRSRRSKASTGITTSQAFAVACSLATSIRVAGKA